MITINERAIYNRSQPIGFKVAPTSKVKLRNVSQGVCSLLRSLGCYKNDHFIDAVFLLENVLQKAGYNYHIIEDADLPDTAAFTIPEKNLVVVRDSIYQGLFIDRPFSRYTIVHEFSHIVLGHAVTLHRGAQLGEHRFYEDSEWQANNLAAEILMPVDVVIALQGNPTMIMSACGVSEQAANLRLTNLRKEQLI